MSDSITRYCRLRTVCIALGPVVGGALVAASGNAVGALVASVSTASLGIAAGLAVTAASGYALLRFATRKGFLRWYAAVRGDLYAVVSRNYVAHFVEHGPDVSGRFRPDFVPQYLGPWEVDDEVHRAPIYKDLASRYRAQHPVGFVVWCSSPGQTGARVSSYIERLAKQVTAPERVTVSGPALLEPSRDELVSVKAKIAELRSARGRSSSPRIRAVCNRIAQELVSALRAKRVFADNKHVLRLS